MKKREKKDWYTNGFSILEKDGFSRITIDNLCKILNVTKGSFYHHFGNIDGYIEELMKYWVQEHTMVFIQKTEDYSAPEKKYKNLSNMTIQAPYKVEQVIRAWSYSNLIVKKYVTEVDKIRLDYVVSLKMEAGEDEETAKYSAIFEYALLIGIQQLYPSLSKEKLAETYARYSFNANQ